MKKQKLARPTTRTATPTTASTSLLIAVVVVLGCGFGCDADVVVEGKKALLRRQQQQQRVLSPFQEGAVPSSNGGGDNDDTSSFIIGGEDTDPDDYPYFTTVQDERCGGVLVAPDIVLTAAHCGNLTDLQVNIGAHEADKAAQPRFCDTWIEDPTYEDTTGEGVKNYHDFALCKLDRPVDIATDRVVRLDLNQDDAFPAEGDELKVMGLGWIDTDENTPDILQDVNVLGISNDVCQDDRWDYQYDPDVHLCAGWLDGIGGKDTCKGDSGGPLISRNDLGDGTYVDTIVGIVSYGYVPCATWWAPAVYARVSSRYDWIRDTMCTDLHSIGPLCDEDEDGSDDDDICGPTDSELVVTVKTDDKFGSLTSWSLHEGTDAFNDPQVKYRNFLYSDYEYEHETLCLKANQCYTWQIFNIRDGFYNLRLNNQIVASGASGGTSQFFDSVTVCTNDGLPSEAPTLAPSVSFHPSSSPSASPSTRPSASPSDSPTGVPTGSPVACSQSDDLVPLKLAMQLDGQSGSEFGWNLVNKLDGSGWEGTFDVNNPSPPNGLLEYTMCVPKNECWVLTIFDTQEDGSGHYTVYLDGEEIVSDGEFTGAEVTHDICIGRDGEHCRDRGGRFKYRKGKKDIKFTCRKLDGEKGRQRKKICEAFYEGRRKVKTRCLDTCGGVGKGPCLFLKDYGDTPASTIQPPVLTTVEPLQG